LRSYCVSECNDQCKEIIEKYQEMECFEELKDSIGELFTNSEKSCCESNQLVCETSPSNLSGGAIAGVVIGSVVLIGIVVAIIIVILFKNKSFRNQSKKLASDSQIQME